MAGEKQLHAQVIKSTTIIGGSSALNVIFRIIQSKAAALLVGPAGTGLMGVFNSALVLASTVAGMGLDTSGVRHIAEASGTGDDDRITYTVVTFRRIVIFFGLLGSLLFFLLRYQIAQLTFGNQKYAETLGVLSVALFCLVTATAQSAFIRGMRRIGDLAKVNIIGIALGTVIGLPVLYFWRLDGIAPYLIISAIATYFISWIYARRISLKKIKVSWNQTASYGKELVSLGFVFMLSGLTTIIITYVVKVMIMRSLGLEASGLYESASSLSNVYVGFILGAMGADYFPHLSAVVHDNDQSNQLMNVQVEIGMLIATPGVLLVLAFGPFLLQLLYSSEFIPAFEILRWQALGTFLRVISWPLGYLILAKGEKFLFFWTELGTNIFYLVALLASVEYMGLPGVGVAFSLMYLFHTLLMIIFARRLAGFQWSSSNLKRLTVLLPIVLAAFTCSYYLTALWSAAVGVVLAIGTGLYSIRALYNLLGPETVQGYIQRIRTRLGLKDQ